MKVLEIRTRKRCEFVDITKEVIETVEESGVKDGIVTIYSPHTTAGVTINEKADPSVVEDMATKLSKLIDPMDPDYRHTEGNSDSHIKTSIVGASETILVEKGRPLLGTWQGIFFAEFDGPRSRKVFVKVIPG